MLEDGFVRLRMFHGDEDVLIHVRPRRTSVWYSRYTLSAAMIMQTGHASAFTQNLLANGPIIFSLLVNCTSGKMANGSWRLRMTWLSTSRGPEPSSPLMAMTIPPARWQSGA